MEKIGLLINGITVEEASEIMKKVREIEQRGKDRTIFVQIKGLVHRPVKEVAEIVRKVFPKRRVAQ